jgi:hypothetical protein
MDAVHSGSKPNVRWKSDWWELYVVLTAGVSSAVALVTWWG